MKKIGILFGDESELPQALVERINSKNKLHFKAEYISINKITNTDFFNYSVILDRVSSLIPFYRGILKHEVTNGTSVINNPFILCSNELFFNYSLASKLGIPVPKSALLPSKIPPDGTYENSFVNLEFPLDWDGIFNYIGFPAQLKMNVNKSNSNWNYFLENIDDFFRAYANTKTDIMVFQAYTDAQRHYRVLNLKGNKSLVMEFSLHDQTNIKVIENGTLNEKKILNTIKKYAALFSNSLGLEINAIEFAVKDDKPIAINLFEPIPKIDSSILGDLVFSEFVNGLSDLLIEKAKEVKIAKKNKDVKLF